MYFWRFWCHIRSFLVTGSLHIVIINGIWKVLFPYQTLDHRDLYLRKYRSQINNFCPGEPNDQWSHFFCLWLSTSSDIESVWLGYCWSTDSYVDSVTIIVTIGNIMWWYIVYMFVHLLNLVSSIVMVLMSVFCLNLMVCNHMLHFFAYKKPIL